MLSNSPKPPRRSQRLGLVTLSLVLVAFVATPGRAAELLGYWDFNGGATDSSGNGADGVLNGGASISADGLGFSSTIGDRALDLGGSGGAARADVSGADFSAATSNNAMAVSFWQYNVGNGAGGNASSTAFGIVSSSGGGGRGFQTHTPWGDGTLYFDHGGACCGGNNRSTHAVGTSLLDSWHHIVLQVEGGRKQIWVDGALAGEQASGAAAIPSFTGQLMIGAEPAGTNNGFGGRIDEFAVWGTFLTPAEIASLAAGASALELVAGDPDLPTLAVSPATAITASTATLNGEVVESGIADPGLEFFYGEQDGGQADAVLHGEGDQAHVQGWSLRGGQPESGRLRICGEPGGVWHPGRVRADGDQ